MTVIDGALSSLMNTNDLAGAQKTKKNELSKDDFMKLFLTQLKLQDPMKPTTNSEMMEQMAQMTSLSSAQDLSKTINSLNQNMSKSQVLEASQLIGKSVQLPSKVAHLSDINGMNGSVVLPAPSNDVTVSITDNNNQVVKSIKLNAMSSGVMDFKWDGMDANGNKMKSDYYNISASATINGKQVAVPTAGTFPVNSVAFDQNNSAVILNLEGIGGVGMNDIIKIV